MTNKSLSTYIGAVRIEEKDGYSCANRRSTAIVSDQHNRLIPCKTIGQESPGDNDIRLLLVKLAVGIKEWNELVKIVKCLLDGPNEACLLKTRYHIIVLIFYSKLFESLKKADFLCHTALDLVVSKLRAAFRPTPKPLTRQDVPLAR